VNKAGTASTNKTGLVLKISIILILALGVILYKFNDYSRNDKVYAMQEQLRQVVLKTKTSVSAQLSQLKNNLSGYENEISETSVNWVQLDPFFVIANVENTVGRLKVNQIVTRSNTPAERWSGAYLEKALQINKSKKKNGILIQLFKDRAGTKFILVRFQAGGSKEIVLASTADYFQKFFDIDRGSRFKSLLITTENILAGHTEADYLATSSKELKMSPTKYVSETEELVGTNLIAVSYVLKSRIVSGFAVPWSIVGVVFGIGFILIGLVYYNLESIERRLDRYKKQEREQIYKDTLQRTVQAREETSLASPPQVSEKSQDSLPLEVATNESVGSQGTQLESTEITKTGKYVIQDDDSEPLPIITTQPNEPDRIPFEIEEPQDPQIFNLLERSDYRPVPTSKSEAIVKPEPEKEWKIESDVKAETPDDANDFVTLDEESIDLDEIEKALALDDFDQEEKAMNVRAEVLEKNLQPQKISLSSIGSVIDKPQFAFDKQDFKVDEIKVNIRRPERS
jgi:hypothetical protein